MEQANTIASVHNAKEVVTSFLKALNDEDFNAAGQFTSDNMKFTGVLGSRDDSQSYFNDMKNMRLKYDIQKIFVNGEDVCVLYNINMEGETIFTCGLYHVEDSKIISIRVVFDPRPLLAHKK